MVITTTSTASIADSFNSGLNRLLGYTVVTKRPVCQRRRSEVPLVPTKTAPGRKLSTGNRRNPQAHAAIIRATLKLLRKVHYPALTIEAIAAEAGVGKATVYRWWPSKGGLVAEAVSSTLTVEDPPETDDLRADLIAAVNISVKNYSTSPGGVLITALAADLADDPELLSSFITQFVQPRRAVVNTLLDRAKAQGLVDKSVSSDLLMDMWAGAVIYRSLMNHLPIGPDFATQLVDAVIGGAAPTPAPRKSKTAAANGAK